MMLHLNSKLKTTFNCCKINCILNKYKNDFDIDILF